MEGVHRSPVVVPNAESPSEPPDREHGCDRRADLERENERCLSGLDWEPPEGEKGNRWNLSGHEELPEVGSGSLISLPGSTVNGGVNHHDGQGRHRHG
jgi:hypothetical protein